LIFEKFYRVDKSRQSNQGGTGLGLNITLILIELHGGKIRAVSEQGEGTEIIFEIPNY
jgi:signal transduction histidine kinase